MIKLYKSDIANTLKNCDFGTLSNESKNYKVNQFLLNNLDLLEDNKNYVSILNNSGCVNRGVLAEEIVKAIYKSSKKQFSTKGHNDMIINNKPIEIKSILNPSNLPRVNVKELENIYKYVVLTYKGIYEIEPNDIKNNINNLNYFRKDGHKMRLAFVEEFGKLNEYQTSKLKGLN